MNRHAWLISLFLTLAGMTHGADPVLVGRGVEIRDVMLPGAIVRRRCQACTIREQVRTGTYVTRRQPAAWSPEENGQLRALAGKYTAKEIAKTTSPASDAIKFKINAKAAFEGDVWQWHQDYGTWARDDGMPEPRAMNIAVFLDEVFPFNGALMLVPRSHKHGTLQAGHDLTTTSYPLWTLDQDAVTRLCREAERPGAAFCQRNGGYVYRR
jgi:hypothetical protein